MKRYEGLKREEPIIYCPECKEEIGFADMVCPHCGADARVEKRIYRPGLSSNDIQPEPRERTGGSHKPSERYLDSVKNIGTVLTMCAIALALLTGFLAGKSADSVPVGILSGVLAAVVLITLSRAIAANLINTAFAAMNAERTALGVEYQIEQFNELLTAYNRDKSIEADNAEVFAKLLVKLNKLEESNEKCLEELVSIVGEMGKMPEKEQVAPIADESKTEFADDFDAEPIQTEEEAAEPEITEAAEVEAVDEIEEAEVTEESEAKEDIKPEEPEEPEETGEIYSVECPKCGNELHYTDKQLDNNETELVCEKCGSSIILEVQDEEAKEKAEEKAEEAPSKRSEEEASIGQDAQSEYERIFGSDKTLASSSLTSRLDAFLDDDDEW